MESKIRKSGIDIIGNTPWGTHFCVFYQTKEDLIDILVPYFKAGLENNEYCLWVTSEPLNEKVAENAIRVAMPNFDEYLKKKQIKIVHYTEWYLRDGVFDLDRVLNGWIEKLENAIENGFEGLRITGNTAWLEKKDWNDFREYEEEINNVIGNFQMMAICTYSLEKCGSFELLDVIQNHQFALLRREGKWKSFKSMEQIALERKLKETELRYRTTFEQSPDGIIILDIESTRAIEFNNAICDILGYSREEFAELKVSDYDAIEAPSNVRAHIEKVLLRGRDDFDTKMRTKNGDIKDIHVIAKVIELSGEKYFQSICRDITERKKTERKLRESEAKLRGIMNSITDQVCILDRNLDILYINSVAEEIYGPSALGSKCYYIFHGLDEICSNCHVRRTFEDSEVHNKECLRRIGEESRYCWCVSNVFERDEEERPISVVEVSRDITERKLKEKELQIQSVIITNLSEGVHLIRVNDGTIIYTNPRIEVMFGYKPGEMIGKNVAIVNAPTEKTSEETREEIMGILKDKGEWHGEVLNVKKDGTPFWCYVNVSLFDHPEYGTVNVSVHTDITERKKIEKNLVESEEKYSTLAKLSPVGIFHTNQRGDCLYINECWSQISGLTLGEALGAGWVDGLHPNDRKRVSAEWYTAAENNVPFESEYRFKRLDGKITWVYGQAIAVKNYLGKITGYVGTITDISKRKQAEQKLKESEEKWRALSENSPAHVMLLDREHKIIFINRTVPDLSKEEVIGTSIYNYIPQEFHKVSKDCNNSVWETGEPKSYHTHYKTKEGDTKYFDMWIGPVFQSGKVIALVSHGMDVTESKKTEEKLKESNEKLRMNEELFRDFFDNAAIGFHIFRPDRTIIDMNKYELDLLGYSLEEIVNKKTWYDIIIPENRPQFEKHWNEILKKGSVNNLEYTLTHKDGHFIDVLLSASLRSDEKGNLISTRGSVIDITKRRKAEQALKESKEKFRLIAEQTLIGIIINHNKNIKYINKAFADIHENSVEEMYEWTLDDLINNVHQDDLPLVREKAKSRETGDKNIHHFSFRIKTKSGKIKWLDIVSRVIQYEEEEALLTTITDITELKEVEKKLKESKHDLDERVKELTCLYELSKLVENPVFSLEDIINGTLSLILPSLQFPDITIARITYDGREYKHANFEKTEWKLSTMVKINEKPLLIEVYYLEDKPFLKEEQDLIRDIGIRLKITVEEKEAQNMLRESEEKYRMGFESSTDGIASADMEGIFIDCNKAFLEMLGYSREELFKLNFREVTPHRWHEMEDSMLISQLADGKDSGIYEKECIQKDGTIFPVNVRFWIIKDDQGDPVRMWTIVRDITEHKKAEEKIADLAKFPSENPHPVLRLNRNKVIYVNNSGRYLLDVEENDEIPDIIQKEVEKAFESNTIIDFDIELKDRIYSFTITPFVKHNYVNLYGMDITESKQAEQKLKEINKFKSEFLRRASHELKTPLISIKGYSDLILALHEDQISSEIISKLNEINRGCERLQNIINNLLETSRLESPELRPKVQKEDLSFLIKFCVQELQSLLQARNQTLKLNILDGQYGIFEKEEIHDVISNLLTNAIKYTPPYGKISINTEEKGDFMIISVKDNGIGFTEEQEGRIFKQFGKIERYGQGLDLGIDGTGLGLYISKRIVESHGGEIWMESEGKNKGCTFYFTIPSTK